MTEPPLETRPLHRNGRSRRVAQAALMVGAVGVIIALLLVARRQRSSVLLIAFVLWDVLPFVLLGVGDRVATAWRLRSRTALHLATVFVVVVTLVAYAAVVLGAWHGHPAAPFLIVPPVSILFVAIVLVITSGKSVRAGK